MAELEVMPQPTGGEPPAAAEQQTNKEQMATERPAWLPEGLNSPEELAAAYAQLKGQNPEEAGGESTVQSDASVSKFVQESGFDPAALSRELAASGDINPEARAAFAKKLETAGLPASMIDEYITGQKAVMEAGVRDIMAVAGGEAGWKEMADWARETLSDAELQAFSNIMTKADMNTAKLTVGNLYARFKATAAYIGERIKGGTGANAGDIFRSWEQQLDAQKDPRYASDPAYRADVERKIERTLKAGGYKHVSR